MLTATDTKGRPRQGRQNNMRGKEWRVPCLWRCRQKHDDVAAYRPLGWGGLSAFREKWRITMHPLVYNREFGHFPPTGNQRELMRRITWPMTTVGNLSAMWRVNYSRVRPQVREPVRMATEVVRVSTKSVEIKMDEIEWFEKCWRKRLYIGILPLFVAIFDHFGRPF